MNSSQSLSTLVATIVVIGLCAGASASEQEFAPNDLHAYETFVLDNGMRIVLNNRGHSPSVTVRLVVGTGITDYPCEMRELPHVVEHLMFSGVGDLEESDLDGMVASWGGAWNAYTYNGRTTYDAYVHSDFLIDLIVLLELMFEETEITPEKLETAKSIVHAEAGGVPNEIRQSLFKYGIFEGSAQRAYRKFVPNSVEWCDRLIDATKVTTTDVSEYRSAEHNADNMVLIVVGKFDIAAFKELLPVTFSGLGGESNRHHSAPPRADTFTPVTYHTRTASLVGQEGYVCLEFGLPPWTAEDRATLLVIQGFLQTRIFDTLRVERGLSFNAKATINDFTDFSTLMLDASVAIEDMGTAMNLIEEVLRDLLQHGVDQGAIDHIRNARLRRLPSKFESNSAIADFYEQGLPLLESQGEFDNLDNYYADVTTEDTKHVARKYLGLESALRYTSRPMLSYGGAVSVMAIPFIGFLAFRFTRRVKG